MTTIDRTDLDYPRRVVVDDTDPRITYTGDWHLDVGTFDDLGIAGAPYNHTLHGTKQNGASLIFEFEGDYIQIRGAKDNRKLPYDPLFPFDNITLLPTWSCQVDGSDITSYDFRNETQMITDSFLCDKRLLSQRRHTLNLTVSINDPDTQMFWLDRIEYQPLEGANVDREVMRIDSSDPSVRYENGSAWWSNSWGLEIYNETRVVGSSLSFTFTGTSASLYTLNYGTEYNRNGAAQYYIDNSDTTPFEIPESKIGPDGVNTTDYANQPLFTTPTLQHGQHDMVITYEGGTADDLNWPQPLFIDYFYVTGANSELQLNSSGSGGGNSSSTGSGIGSLDQGSSGSKARVGAIVGGVIGGIGGLAILIAVIWILIKRERLRPGKGRYDLLLDDTEGIFTTTPFRMSSTTPVHRPKMDELNSHTNSQNSDAQQGTVPDGVVQHQDSGIRYHQQDEVASIPPRYTPK